MSILNFFIYLGSFIVLIFAYLGVGRIVSKNIIKNLPAVSIVGIYIMLGFGIITYLSLIAGVLGSFNNSTIAVIYLSAIFISLLQIKQIYLDFKKIFISIIKYTTKNKVATIFNFISLIILSTLYLSSLQPPNASDELHYHLPEVKQIITSNKINLNFDGHYFYGNIPKLMEVSFASVCLFFDYNFTHLVNFLVFISFLLIIFGILAELFSFQAAALAIFFLVTFDDLTWNATTGYIDTATLSFELSSLLILLYILYKKGEQKFKYLIPGLLIGLALACKYSPIPTFLFMIITLVILGASKLFRKKNNFIIKNMFYFFLGAALTGSLWYIKNLILYQNPFYPLYMGHVGVDELSYLSLIGAIQQFGPKTLSNFINILSHYKTVNGIFVYLSFFIAPLIFFFKKDKKFIYPLLFYYLLYTYYWFNHATHQIRFLAPAFVISLILLAILISKLPKLITISVFTVFFLTLYLNPSYWRSFWNTKFHLTERQYAFGKISKTDFLVRNFGCQYNVIKFLEDKNLQGTVIDNWSVWHAPSVSFYAQKNKFVTFGFDLNNNMNQLSKTLQGARMNYIYFNQDVKKAHLENKDEQVVLSRKNKVPLESYLLKHSKLIFENDKCFLYEIDYDRIK